MGRGMVTLYLSVIVLVPLAALASKAFSEGLDTFWDAGDELRRRSRPLKLTVISSLIVVAINAIVGTIIAWVLVRDDFPGKGLVNSVIDLPFALPTIVAGLTLLALYGDDSPIGISLAFTKASVVLALLFVTLPFVVRAVQPVLIELDRDMEEAAASLGARPFTVFRKIMLPNLRPAIFTGVGARVRPRDRRVRIARAAHGQHRLQDRGGVGVRLQSGPERQRGRRGRRVGGAARRSRS